MTMDRAPRPIRIEGNIAYVPLTKGYEAIVDACDVHLVDQWNWYAHVCKNTVYARRNTPQDADGKQQGIFMHRALMSAPPEIEVDHEKGNGLDNRRKTNLRLATTAQNQHNQRINRKNTSGIKGVSWHARNQKWRADIQLDGKQKHLGCFDERELAAVAYARASADLHGQFGRLK